MTAKALDLFGNPVRMRIVHCLYDGRELTTAELCAHLPDVSQATMYRHVADMERAGALEVVRAEKVRGAIERTYRLRPSAAHMSPAERADMTAEDLQRTMATVASVMVAEFNQLLAASKRPPKDAISLAQFTLWLSDEELADLSAAMRAFIGRNLANTPRGRRRYLLSPTCFPLAPHKD
ncbi:MAG: helix-turn-helix domain-containing protein [Alphaproteobacteria bacterium]|nr:helix-turn-helix domain-containing protein [Alphaproteobacteria bacterium]